jgi:hypothetical protein
MSKNNKPKPQLADFMEFKSVSFVNVGLPEDLNKRLNKYVLGKAQEAGRVSYGLKTAIMRMALLEWLNKHENDLSL